MTALGKETIEQWKAKGQRVLVYSQEGRKEEGRLIDYDDTEIVLEQGDANSWYPITRIVCRNWFSVKECTDW